MTEHLTEQQIESFRRRKMSPGGLLAAHRHLAVCEVCRGRIGAPRQVALAFAAFERELQQVDVEDEHLHYQQLSDYVDEELRETDREIVESHLEDCAECAAEVTDLRAFKSTITAKESELLKATPRREPSAAWWNWSAGWNPLRAALTALVVIVMLMTVFVLLRNRVSRQDRARLTTPVQSGAGAGAENSPARPAPETPPQTSTAQDETEKLSDNDPLKNRPRDAEQLRSTRGATGAAPSSNIVVSLKDGERVVTLDSGGHIYGIAADVPGMQRLLAQALRSQRLEKPPILKRLIRAPGTQLDIARQSSSFALERPVGTVVQSERPTFFWKPLEGASGYIVSVFDAQLNEVARSEALSTTSWTTPRALRRGAIYRWQVVAVKDGHEVVMPSPTAPEARFKVLEQQQAEALARARQSYADSHLALGLLYAQRGLLDDAETELQALVKDNPTSSVARKLLESLRAWRIAQASKNGADSLR
jgi:hypothetical protein